MSLQGMTGFARSRVEDQTATAQWELRSVNGRGLDIRIRMPQGMERFEPAVRAALQKSFARGSLNATLAFSNFAGATQPSINEALLHHYANAAIRLHEMTGVALAAADGLLRLPGVIESGSTETVDDEERGALILKALE